MGKNRSKLFILSLTALGVVYGDIGTSPLYAINEIFFGHGKATTSTADILGGISLVIWALSLLVTIKYIFFVLKADYKGEGGVFALYSLIDKLNIKKKLFITTLLIIAAGLLLGDGIITPAISVISAVEGIGIATSSLTPFIIPITIVILTILFTIQSKGTAKVGVFFAPLIIIWFITIAFFGLIWVVKVPVILLAFNPLYAAHFIISHSFLDVLLTLGAVMLVITGGEAMYADMGHFGAKPIRLSWFALTYPSLLFNYLGQGGYLLSTNKILNGNVFFSMIPHAAIIPMVILATLAAIIASQALISGAFSLSSQAISLGFFPYLRIVHTHDEQSGQIYVPFINWALYIGCISLVVFFQSSNRLAAAYVFPVSGVMLVTSLSMIFVAKHYWKWHPLFVYALFIPFIIIDASFLTANSLKIIEGGYIPLGIGIFLLIIMQTWRWGRKQIRARYTAYPTMTIGQLIDLKKKTPISIEKTHIFMTPNERTHIHNSIPCVSQLFFERYNAIPLHIIFLTVKQIENPYVGELGRFIIHKLFDDPKYGSILAIAIQFGFMENPNVENALRTLQKKNYIHVPDNHKQWNITILQERNLGDTIKSFIGRIRFQLYEFLVHNTDTADIYFGLGKEKNLTSEIIPVYIK